MLSILHVSDLHFGRPAVRAQIEAIEETIRDGGYDVVVISGDLTQRARAGEFQRAYTFLRDTQKYSQTVVVPGNHDVSWWRAPLGLRDRDLILEAWRTHLWETVEPVLRVEGATFVGLNTAQGVSRRTLTWNVRDLSIIGDLRKSQIEWAAAQFEQSPPADARIIVMHHNPVKGELSQRHGLKHTKKILGAFAEIGVDLVCCGHDHQEAIHYIEHTRKGTVISTAGTVSNRSRGGRPSSVNHIDVSPDEIHVVTYIWSSEGRTFVPGSARRFPRHRA
jgi:3',5'-cyclic AMP phosphodiesterase CpdA